MAVVATGEMTINPDTKGFESALGKVAKKAAAAFGGVFAAQKAFQFGGDVIKEASDLGESINAINVAFGKSAQGVLALGENSAKSLGLSRNEFNALAVRFSAFAETIAGKGGSASKIIDSLTKRGADFASVFNIQVDEALQLFQSGLAGETEPLRKFGIDLSAAAVEAFAYANGIAKTGEKLTEAQKVQARYGALLAQTAKVQGDFQNTSGSLANQQRILGATFDNLKAKLGAGLLPIMTKVTSFLATNLPAALAGAGRAFTTIRDIVVPFINALRTGFTEDEGTGVERWALRLREAFIAIGQAAKNLFEDQIKPLAEFFAQNVVPVLGTVATKLAEFGLLLGRNIETVKKVAAVIGTLLIPHFIRLGVEATLSAAKQVAAWIATKTQAIAATFVSSAQFAIQIARWVALGAAATANAAVIAAAWLVSLGPIALVGAAVVALVALVVKNWDTIKNAITTAVSFIINFVRNNWPLLIGILTGPIGLAVGLIIKNFDKIKEVGSSVFGAIAGAVERFVNVIRGALDWIGKLISAISRIKFPKLPGQGVLGNIVGAIPGFAEGGVVPGRIGAPQLAVVHGGETVTPPGQSAPGGTMFRDLIIQGATFEGADRTASSVVRELRAEAYRQGR